MDEVHLLDWTPPVVLLVNSERSFIMIRNVYEAAKFLVGLRPTAPGPAFREAVSTCAAALDGKADAHTARLAFLVAAHEARIAITFR